MTYINAVYTCSLVSLKILESDGFWCLIDQLPAPTLGQVD